MKTKAKLFFAAIFTAVLLFTTSCALDIVAPKNKWVTYEYPIEKNDKIYVVLCHAYYSENETTVQTYSGNGSIKIKPGLTIVANPRIYENSNDTEVFQDLFGDLGENFTKDSYAIKTFDIGENVDYSENGDENNKKQFKLSYTTWLILYNSIINEGVSTRAPEVLKDGNAYNEAFQNFKWKKLIYYMAINKLTDLAAAE